MSYYRKIVACITVILVLITGGGIFVFFDPPYTVNFRIAAGFIVLSEIILGGSWIWQIEKSDETLPVSLGACGVNFLYVVSVVALGFFTEMRICHFLMCEMILLSALVIVQLLFRIGERHIEEQAKDDVSEEKIKRAQVNWR